MRRCLRPSPRALSLFTTIGTTGQVKSAQQQLHAFERNLQKNQGDGEGGEADAERLKRQEYDDEVKLKAQEIRRDWKLQRRDVSEPNPRLSAIWLHPIPSYGYRTPNANP